MIPVQRTFRNLDSRTFYFLVDTDGSLSKPHAVVTAGSNAYCYDRNGNQVKRTIGGSTYTLSYDAENHLIGVSGAATATFVYDGDGVRVKGTVNGVTTAYVGEILEWTGSTSTMVKYYYAGGTRVAMRNGTTLYWLIGDHLSSTSVVANSTGGLHSKMLYKAWGEVRYASASLPTRYTYTGQHSYMDDPATPGGTEGFGLMFYRSRWYDPLLSRFAQADTLCQIGLSGSGNSLACTVSYSDPKILAQYNFINNQPNGIVDTVQASLIPQNLDRYTYAGNNPLKYVDDTGHCFGFAGGADTVACTFFAMAGPPGWVIDGLIIIGGVIIVGGVAYLASDYYADQQPYFARGDGGAASSAQHLAMMLGVSVAGFGPHPGMPDPEGRDRKHNAEGLRNDLRNILRNRKSGETLEQYLSRQRGWTSDMVKDYSEQLRYYLKNVLPAEKNFDPKLIEDILNLARELGI